MVEQRPYWYKHWFLKMNVCILDGGGSLSVISENGVRWSPRRYFICILPRILSLVKHGCRGFRAGGNGQCENGL